MENIKKHIVLKVCLALLPTVIFWQNYAWMSNNKILGISFLIFWFLMIWNVSDFSEKDQIFERHFRLTEIAFFLFPVSTIVMMYTLGSEAITSSSDEFEMAGAAIGTMIGGTFVVTAAFVIGMALGVIMHLIANKYNKKITKDYKKLSSKHGIVLSLAALILLVIVASTISQEKPSIDQVTTEVKTTTKQPPKKIEDLTSKVGMEITEKEYVEGDFQDAINMEINFINKTEKDIRGVQGIVTFYDIFDNKIKSNQISYDEGIPANSNKVWEASLSYNQFMDEDNKLKNTELENLRIEWKVTDIVYADESENASQEIGEVSRVGLEILEKNFKTVGYQDFITFKLKLKNNTEKNIKGVQGNIVFYDIFDNEIYTLTIPYDEGITANGEAEWEAAMDYNMFIDEDNKLKNMPLANLTYKWNIDTIVYEDGTKEKL